MDQIAKQVKAEVYDPGFIQRRQEGIDEGIINVAYRVPEPQFNKKTYTYGRINKRGDFALVELAEVGTRADIEEQNPELDLSWLALQEYNLVMQTLVQTVEYRILEDRLFEETEKLAGTN